MFKTDLGKKSYEIRLTMHGPGIKYSPKRLQYVQYFASKYLKWILGEKSHQIKSVKYAP